MGEIIWYLSVFDWLIPLSILFSRSLLHCWWKCRLVQPLWKAVWRYLIKLKNGSAFWPGNPTSGDLSKENWNANLKKYKHPMFTAVLFKIAKIWRQPSCYPSVDEWIKKMWCIYTMEYYLAIKKEKELLPCATAWMDMENFMLSEISQSEKDKYHMISLICGI